MLEALVFDQETPIKENYKQEYSARIDELVVLQQQARSQGIGLVVLFEGWNGAGKGSRISDLMYNLDARATSVYVTPDFNTEEARAFAGRTHGVSGYYPRIQEFWRALGARGTMTIFDRGWYTAAEQQLFFDHYGKLDPTSKEIRQVIKKAGLSDTVEEFERQLVDDGYLVIKFFIHVTKDGQRERLARLRSDPDTSWRVSDEKFKQCKNYDEAYRLYDALLEESNFAFAPWEVLNGEDKRATNLRIAQVLAEAIKSRLESGEDKAAAQAAAKAQANSAAAAVESVANPASGCVVVAGKNENDVQDEDERTKRQANQKIADEQAHNAPKTSRFTICPDYPKLEKVDHTLALSEKEYKKARKYEQKRLNELEMEMFQQRIPLIIMYEGWDAAGKGGNIKRIAQALDARAYTVFPSPAPTKPELMHPHLWRYWTRLPKAGHVGIYDRSWYGRVLVERVEGFASDEQWSRAYDEINEFERELVRWGAILLKFWVEISADEQLKRFQARADNPKKQWKITDEDWRNRDKYPQYKAAVDDMFRLTSTDFAPWRILESDNKYYARIKALKTINNALDVRLRGK